MDRMAGLTTFVRVVASGGFTAAARRAPGEARLAAGRWDMPKPVTLKSYFRSSFGRCRTAR